MPREYREKNRKKTRYSSDDSSDEYAYREKSRRERSRSKRSSEKYRSSRKRRDSSSKSSSSSVRRSSSSTSTNSSDSKSRYQKKKSSSKETEQVKTFELDDLYKSKDKAKVLEEIESDTFKQASFKQSSSSKIIVDLEKDKIMIPTTSTMIQQDESLIHPNFLGDNDKRVDKWIKKLHIYRNQ